MKALDFITFEEVWSRRMFCVAYMCVFGCIAYAMVPNEKRDKLDAKGTKCLVFD